MNSSHPPISENSLHSSKTTGCISIFFGTIAFWLQVEQHPPVESPCDARKAVYPVMHPRAKVEIFVVFSPVEGLVEDYVK
ncbi:hypothetical protein TNCT_521771 [Trichonephila clavata]|uniref:Uncharacterized protein n=1 Tax=Trichonephila clavata TaxID=2740835 RepID=A0A8X6FLZ7_TRICU|nr:hypothetical protein TNCT_521771 [Trichonephila clavata]